MFTTLSSLMAAPDTNAAVARPQLPQHIEAYGDEIRNLKESLKAQGVSNKAMKAHPQVAAMVARLDQMKAQAGIDPKTNLPFNVPVPRIEKAPKPEVSSRGLPSELQGMGLQLRDLKSNLKARGMNNNQIKQQPQVLALTRELNSSMQARVPQKPKPGQPATSWAASWFTGSTTAPQGSPILSPEAQAYKQQLQGVKRDLKSQGIKGPQLVQHGQVRAMQSQLDQMISGRNPAHQIPSQVSFVGASARQQAMTAATTGRAPPSSAPQMMQRPSGMSFSGYGGQGGPMPSNMSFSGYGGQGAPMPHSVSFRR